MKKSAPTVVGSLWHPWCCIGVPDNRSKGSVGFKHGVIIRIVVQYHRMLFQNNLLTDNKGISKILKCPDRHPDNTDSFYEIIRNDIKWINKTIFIFVFLNDLWNESKCWNGSKWRKKDNLIHSYPFWISIPTWTTEKVDSLEMEFDFFPAQSSLGFSGRLKTCFNPLLPFLILPSK